MKTELQTECIPLLQGLSVGSQGTAVRILHEVHHQVGITLRPTNHLVGITRQHNRPQTGHTHRRAETPVEIIHLLQDRLRFSEVLRHNAVIHPPAARDLPAPEVVDPHLLLRAGHLRAKDYGQWIA